MKLKIFHLTLLAAAAASFLSACKKEDTCTAGTGGGLTLVVYPQHHGVSIPNQDNYRDTVMVKFNTQEFPGAGPSLYDLVVAGDSAEDHVHIPGLTCGDYYIYAVGFDTTQNKRVTGGMPFSTSATSGEVIVHLPVTE